MLQVSVGQCQTRLSIGQCQLQFSFFVFGLLSYQFFFTFTVTIDFKSQYIVTLAYLSLRYACSLERGGVSEPSQTQVDR
jgi:hypothetical protein